MNGNSYPKDDDDIDHEEFNDHLNSFQREGGDYQKHSSNDVALSYLCIPKSLLSMEFCILILSF